MDEVPKSLADISPVWLEQVLRPTEGDIKVLKVETSGGVAPGENYISLLEKLKVTVMKGGKENVMNLIVKMSIEKSDGSSFSSKAKFFQREVEVYTKFMPAMLKMQSGTSIQPPSPVCYYGAYRDGFGCLIMDDLTAKGYSLQGIASPLQFSHAKLVFTELAHYHALGYSLIATNPGIVSECPYIFKPDMDSSILTALFKGFEGCMKLLASSPDHQTKALKIKQFMAENDILSYFSDLFGVWNPPIRVVTHGDLWNNNVMFKQASESALPDAVKFVDWQLGRMVSPVIDMVYFLYTSCSKDVIVSHSDELVRIYQETFCRDIQKLVPGSVPHVYPLEDLRQDFKKARRFGFFTATFILPLMLCKNDNKFEDIQQIGALMEKMGQQMGSGECPTILKTRLIELVDASMEVGLFD